MLAFKLWKACNGRWEILYSAPGGPFRLLTWPVCRTGENLSRRLSVLLWPVMARYGATLMMYPLPRRACMVIFAPGMAENLRRSREMCGRTMACASSSSRLV